MSDPLLKCKRRQKKKKKSDGEMQSKAVHCWISVMYKCSDVYSASLFSFLSIPFPLARELFLPSLHTKPDDSG